VALAGIEHSGRTRAPQEAARRRLRIAPSWSPATAEQLFFAAQLIDANSVCRGTGFAPRLRRAMDHGADVAGDGLGGAELLRVADVEQLERGTSTSQNCVRRPKGKRRGPWHCTEPGAGV